MNRNYNSEMGNGILIRDKDYENLGLSRRILVRLSPSTTFAYG